MLNLHTINFHIGWIYLYYINVLNENRFLYFLYSYKSLEDGKLHKGFHYNRDSIDDFFGKKKKEVSQPINPIIMACLIEYIRQQLITQSKIKFVIIYIIIWMI